MISIKAEIEKIKNRIIVKISKTKCRFFEKINKVDL